MRSLVSINQRIYELLLAKVQGFKEILFAFLAAACALPAPDSGEFSLEEEDRQAFITFLDLLREEFVSGDIGREPSESDEYVTQLILTVIDKLKAATVDGNFDQFDVLEGEEEATLYALFQAIDEVISSFDEFANEDAPRVARRVRSIRSLPMAH